MTNETAYIIKCDDCRAQIGETDSLRESAEGGCCIPCREKRLERGAIEIVRGAKITRYYYSQADDLGRRNFGDWCASERRGQMFFAVPFPIPGGER